MDEQTTLNSGNSAKKYFSHIGLSLCVLIAITLLLQMVCLSVYNVFSKNMSGLVSDLLNWVATLVPMYAIAIPVTIKILGKTTPPTVEKQDLSFPRLLVLLLICFPMMYIGNLIGTGLSSLLSSGQSENALFGLVGGNVFVRILFMVILAPLFEELLFRKALIDRTVKYGEKSAVIFSAIMFGLFHMNLYQFFYAVGLGFVFGYAYLRTGKIRYSFFLHAVINFVGSVLAPWIVEISGASLDGTVSAQNSILIIYSLGLVTVSLIGLILMIVKTKKAQWKTSEENLQKGTAFATIYGNAGVIVYVVLCVLLMAATLAAPMIASGISAK